VNDGFLEPIFLRGRMQPLSTWSSSHQKPFIGAVKPGELIHDASVRVVLLSLLGHDHSQALRKLLRAERVNLQSGQLRMFAGTSERYPSSCRTTNYVSCFALLDSRDFVRTHWLAAVCSCAKCIFWAIDILYVILGQLFLKPCS
jgi:hypothetical protein